jgi:DNA mismatch repair protein MutH
MLAPNSETALLQQATKLNGLTLQQLSNQLDVILPSDFQHHKGWLGQLIELALGATAGSSAEPDFPALGIELKTIPLNQQGKPLESTFVCAVPSLVALHWRDSLVWKKLKKVLWLPIYDAETIPERKIGRALLWQPTAEQEQALQQDWEELTDMLLMGGAEQLTAKHGEVLQIRPKAANASVLQQAIDSLGNSTKIVPKGFYLRPSFTHTLLTLNK